MTNPRIAVFGITGQQGSWVAKSFASRGFNVIGITRNLTNDKVANLIHYEIRVADLCDEDQVARAVKDCDVVFGLTQPWLPSGKVDPQLEAKQGEGLAKGCAKAKVKHLIYSSVQSMQRLEFTKELQEMPHIREKQLVLRLCRQLNVPITVVGPTHFMDNWISPFLSVYDGLVCGMGNVDTKMPYVSCRDIGEIAYVAHTMGPPAKDRYLPAWTDFVSGAEVCRILAKIRADGRQFDYWNPSVYLLKAFAPEVAKMKEVFDKYGSPPESEQQELISQLNETRDLLKNDYWTLERWFLENGFATKKLPPRPVPLWKKLALVVGVVAAAVGIWLVVKKATK